MSQPSSPSDHKTLAISLSRNIFCFLLVKMSGRLLYGMMHERLTRQNFSLGTIDCFRRHSESKTSKHRYLFVCVRYACGEFMCLLGRAYVCCVTSVWQKRSVHLTSQNKKPLKLVVARWLSALKRLISQLQWKRNIWDYFLENLKQFQFEIFSILNFWNFVAQFLSRSDA